MKAPRALRAPRAPRALRRRYNILLAFSFALAMLDSNLTAMIISLDLGVEANPILLKAMGLSGLGLRTVRLISDSLFYGILYVVRDNVTPLYVYMLALLSLCQLTVVISQVVVLCYNFL